MEEITIKLDKGDYETLMDALTSAIVWYGDLDLYDDMERCGELKERITQQTEDINDR